MSIGLNRSNYEHDRDEEETSNNHSVNIQNNSFDIHQNEHFLLFFFFLFSFFQEHTDI